VSPVRTLAKPQCHVLQRSNEEFKSDIRNVKSPLAALQFHDLRDHTITELAEGHASDQTIRSTAGTSRKKCWSTNRTLGWTPSERPWTTCQIGGRRAVTSQSTSQTDLKT